MIYLKRMLLGLLVCGFVVFMVGAAFAADTKNQVVVPEESDYEGRGIEIEEFVTGVDEILGKIGGTSSDPEIVGEKMKGLLNDVFAGRYVAFAFLYTLETTSSLTYQPDVTDEYLYDFVGDKFDLMDGTEIDFSSSGGKYYLTIDSGGILSARGEGAMPGGGGGGCSAFQVGAVILFALPVLALLKRKKK